MIYFKLFVVFFFSLFVTFMLVKFQKKIGLFALINHRSMHKYEMPNSGGIAIFLSFLLSIFLFDMNLNIGIFFSIILIFSIGLYDDIFGASFGQKVFFIFIIGNILYFNGFYVRHLGVFWGYNFDISSILAYFFLSFALIGFVNSVNLIDGLDGLASIVGIVILSSFLYLGIKFNDDFLIYISSYYIMSICGFLFYNYYPAKIFMGDSGSLSLGLIIAIVAIYSVNKHYITLATTMLLAALPILDTLIVMTRRIGSGKSPFVADKLHIHHLIYRQQSSNTRRTVFILGLMQLVFSYIGLGFKIRDDLTIIVLFVMLFILFYYLLKPRNK